MLDKRPVTFWFIDFKAFFENTVYKIEMMRRFVHHVASQPSTGAYPRPALILYSGMVAHFVPCMSIMYVLFSQPSSTLDKPR